MNEQGEGRVRLGYSLLSSHRSELMGVAMLWVMLFHCFPLVIPVHFIDAVKRIGYGGVDIFILLSAMGLTLSALKKPRPYGKYLVRRAGRILPAFYIVTIPFYLWKLLTGRIALKSALLNLVFLGFWLDAPDHFNWYIPALLVFYLLAPLFILAVAKSGRARDIVTVFGCVVGVAVCETASRVGLAHLLDFLYRFPIFWIGVRLGFAVHEDKKLTLPRALFWLAMLAAGTLYISFRQFLPFYIATVYGFILTTVPLCLVLTLLFDKLPVRPALWALRQIGTCSLEIYLVNATWFIEFDFFSSLLGLRPSVYCLVGAPINILLGIALHYAIEAVRKRIGKKSRNNKFT